MLKPQQNVLYCFIGGLLAAVLLDWAKRVGYAVPDTVETGLPAAITASIAYGHDVLTAWLASKGVKK